MALPPAVEAFWNELQAARREVLREVEGLSQAQTDWKPSDKDWSIGEIVHHLTLSEISNGKLTTKLIKEGQAAGKLAPYPPDLTALTPLPTLPPGPAIETPPHIWPEKGRRLGQLLAEMNATRERSYQSIERLGSVDPRLLTWRHSTIGIEFDLGQWWRIILNHDRMHLQQIRGVKGSPGFPPTP
ncbi:MAG: DinB family protein [Candidatus Rokubacteria bacterium]|nr:DinB family protein [Candidatus Rokubacteria bacterium]